MSGSRGRMRGFTLIEVVVAFAILGISLAALYETFAAALIRSRSDAHTSEATLLAQSLLARTSGDFSAPLEVYSGEWQGYQYTVTREIQQPPLGQRPITLPVVRVTAAVSWQGNSGTRELELATLKLATRKSGP